MSPVPARAPRVIRYKKCTSCEERRRKSAEAQAARIQAAREEGKRS